MGAGALPRCPCLAPCPIRKGGQAMNDEAASTANGVTEVVGRFADRTSFQAAVEALLAAGFDASELSVLDTHEALSASESSGEAWRKVLAGLVGEVKYLGPLTTSGLIAIASGSVGAAIASALAAGLAGGALHDLLREVRATPHTEAFARALENGAVLLWVHAESEARQDLASRILSDQGGADVHSHRRPLKV